MINNKTELTEKIIDILRCVHVHGVDGDFDGCDGLDKDPQSMSVQTATKKLSRIMNQAISQTRQELIGEIKEIKDKKQFNFDAKYPDLNDGIRSGYYLAVDDILNALSHNRKP